MKIWAHRGCSRVYPENTLLAFEKAAEIQGLTGIELDIQLTRDNQMVVCHDGRVDRTTDGTGEIRTFSLTELKKLNIDAGKGLKEHIPTMEEVLDLLDSRLRSGLLLNIELKNSVIPYEGMEKMIVELIYSRGLEERIVYSSFSAWSLERLKEIDSSAEIGILDTNVSDCLYKLKGGCGATALHPNWGGIDLPPERLEGYNVRAWAGGRLYPEKPTGGRLDLETLERKGITDVFLNEPERYLNI